MIGKNFIFYVNSGYTKIRNKKKLSLNVLPRCGKNYNFPLNHYRTLLSDRSVCMSVSFITQMLNIIIALERKNHID